MQEAEGDVEGGAAPHLQRSGVAQRMRRRGARLQDVVRADPRRQQALVGVPPARGQSIPVEPVQGDADIMSHTSALTLMLKLLLKQSHA